MQVGTKILILAAVALSAAGQLLLKSGARHLTGLGRTDFMFAAARDPHVVSAIGAWGASTLCWLYVLRVAPLSRVYGLTSLGYVVVPLVSVWLFGEHVRRVHLFGMVLIVVGIACVLSGD
jgi:multidrug transporter EmrE-like cation transporter